ncbi:lysoplasmalogenase [Streptomyces pyxinae]|uniref:lysoplasmalogenase n=1 Tax=Streptomyces pyxinae TaxID=2970734 RepID=UPI003D18318E
MTGTGGRAVVPAARAGRAGALLLGAFGLAVVTDLTALLGGSATGHLLAKPLLMPLLLAYAAVCRAPRPLLAALVCGWGGDVLLLADGAEWAFLAGMGSFALGHLCYLVAFRGTRRAAAPGRGRVVTGGYGAALVVTVALLWPGLPAGLRLPVAGYATLLTVMARGAAGLGAVAGAGGALFLLSDTLIAGGVAGWPQPPVPDFWIMLSYAAAQYLLVTGILARASAPRPRPGS